MTASREIKEGQQVQGVGESIAYRLTTTRWGSSPSAISVKVFTIDGAGDKTDVTSTVMPTGSASAAGDVITLPLLTALKKGILYRVEVAFTDGNGNTFEPFAYVLGEE